MVNQYNPIHYLSKYKQKDLDVLMKGSLFTYRNLIDDKICVYSEQHTLKCWVLGSMYEMFV